MIGEPATITGVSVAAFADSGTITAGSGTITLYAISAPGITGLLTITEEPDAITAAGHIGDTPEPPGLAESLLIIFARTTRAKDIDALMGDFAEHFARDCASGMSRPRAVRRYRAKVLRSVWPQMWQAVRRVGWLGLIVEFLRRWF